MSESKTEVVQTQEVPHASNGQAPRRKIGRRQQVEDVDIEDKDGKVLPYQLRGLSGPQRESYMSYMAGRAKYNNNGTVKKMDDLRGMHSTLLKLGVYDPQGAPVSDAVLATWTGETIAEVYDLLRNMSGFGERAEEDAKNS